MYKFVNYVERLKRRRLFLYYNNIGAAYAVSLAAVRTKLTGLCQREQSLQVEGSDHSLVFYMSGAVCMA